MFKSNTMALAVGSGGITSPFWSIWLTSGYQWILAIAGAVVLGLTIYNKVLEIIQRRRDLKQPKR